MMDNIKIGLQLLLCVFGISVAVIVFATGISLSLAVGQWVYDAVKYQLGGYTCYVNYNGGNK